MRLTEEGLAGLVLMVVGWVAALVIFSFLVCATSGCAMAPTKDALRDTVHARHTDCLARVADDEHVHGTDAMAFYKCARDEDAECAALHLEPRCGEWQATP